MMDLIWSHFSDADFLLFIQYQRAVAYALMDRVPDEKASTVTTVSIWCEKY